MKEVTALIDALNYQVDYGNDISVETAKDIILRSINVSAILQELENDGLDEFQKEAVLQEIKNIVNVITDYPCNT